MDSQGLESGPFANCRLLTGGTQNLLFRFSRGSRSYVLRQPPHSGGDRANETMRREARVLGALAGTSVPHAGLIAACSNPDVLGAAFYLMEPMDGFDAFSGLPARHAASPDIRRRMGFALAEAAADLGNLD
ncbi:phosphotransferase (plasmid) [Sphingobium sp. JS3065]|uniref:phosphotransferase n=1 Tax=Sphingobium sp. JS3065 TaxID=2970925 RepID=UPI0022655A33|nr:phosphotransferase [Sphingobium sp. JS3065]UZW58266.1 phosphotransferase [Sphingobium sp. JS3065]